MAGLSPEQSGSLTSENNSGFFLATPTLPVPHFSVSAGASHSDWFNTSTYEMVDQGISGQNLSLHM